MSRWAADPGADGRSARSRQCRSGKTGSFAHAGGNDSPYFYAGSEVTGNIDGGGGTNDLTLSGDIGTEDELTGALKHFTTLTKDGEGTWIVSGDLMPNVSYSRAIFVISSGGRVPEGSARREKSTANVVTQRMLCGAFSGMGRDFSFRQEI